MLRASLVLTLVFTLLTGAAYPLAVTGIGQALWPVQANGSLIEHAGKIIGSDLVAQGFSDPRWFHPRPSAAKYDGASSTGSNHGPTSAALLAEVKDRAEAARALDKLDKPAVERVTASGSGLDPHLTPSAAHQQVARVAAARGLPEDRVRALVAALVEPPFLGVFGQARVNVLRLNLALESLAR